MAQCHFCDELFSSRNKLFSHIRISHDDEYQKFHNIKIYSCGANEADDANRALLHNDKIKDEDDDDSIDQNNDSTIDKCITILINEINFMVIYKPQGMPSMGSKTAKSLVKSDQLLLSPELEGCNYDLSYKKAVICHRLDGATGGLMVCSKSRKAESHIKQSFRDKKVCKRYRALVIGRVELPDGVITEPLSGKEAITTYKAVMYTPNIRYGIITTLDLWPITGKRHQLRRHLKAIGHPILGDHIYSHASTWPLGIFRRLFLTSMEIYFPDPAFEHEKTELGMAPQQLETNPESLANYQVAIPPFVSLNCTSTIPNMDEANSSSHFIVKFERNLITKMVHVEIDEPSYYLEYRDHSKIEYELSLANSTRV